MDQAFEIEHRGLIDVKEQVASGSSQPPQPPEPPAIEVASQVNEVDYELIRWGEDGGNNIDYDPVKWYR